MCKPQSDFDQNFHIYLCFGQSNMEGQGRIDPIDTIEDKRFKVLQALDCPNLNRIKGEWYNAIAPICQCHTGLSPLNSFGKTLTKTLPDNKTIGVISVAIGGCDIRLFDKDDYLNYDSTYTQEWFTNKIKAYGGNPYEHFIGLAKSSQEKGVIKGILLHQGETNTGDSEWPNYVKRIYNNIINDLNLNKNDVPIFAGEVLSEPNNCCAEMNEIINKLPETIDNSYVISSKGCPGMDNAHFNSEGYRLLGERYALKVLKEIYNKN